MKLLREQGGLFWPGNRLIIQLDEGEKDQSDLAILFNAYQMAGVHHSLGYYPDETSAALAYNEGAKRLHGEFACLNKVDLK